MRPPRRIVTENQVWSAVIGAACLLYLAVILASLWVRNRPPLMRDQFRVVKGTVYAVRGFHDKHKRLVVVDVSVRTSDSGSWTGVAGAPDGMQGSPEIHALLNLTGLTVELRADARSIRELKQGDRTLVPLHCQAPFAKNCPP